MALATSDDVEARLGRDLTDTEEARIDALLEDVSNSVILYTGQTFELTTTTIRLKIKYGVVRLPQRPVVSVDAVQNVDGNDVSYQWDTRDRLDIPGWGSPLNSFEIEPYRMRPNYVDVTYEHGYEEIPGAIVGLVCNIALRNLGQDPTDSATISESIDDYSYRLHSASGAGAYGLLADEKSMLDHYKRTGGSMTLAGR